MESFFPVLSRCPLFASVETENLPALLGCLGARVQQIAKGGAILCEGDPAESFGILLQGGAQVIREDYEGNRSILTPLYPSDLFAEAFACAGAPVLPVSVVATEPSAALLINADRMMHPCESSCPFHHQMIYNMMKILATKNLLCNQKIEILSKRTTRDRLMTYLAICRKKAASHTFSIPFNRQELADYLEVDRSGLSVEISKLRAEGLLVCDRSSFTLLRQSQQP